MREFKAPSPAHELRSFTTSPTRGEVILKYKKPSPLVKQMIHISEIPSPLVGESGPKGRVRGTTYLPLIFSLVLHGAFASFLFLPSQEIVEISDFTVAVQWVEEAPPVIYPSPAHELRSFATSPTRGEVIRTVKNPSSLGEQVIDTSNKTSPLVGEGGPKDRVRGIKHSQPHKGSHNDEEAKKHASHYVAEVPILKKRSPINHKPLPKYPWICRKRRQEGSVSLVVETNKEGYVTRVSVHKSSGYAALDQAALTAVKAWVFDDPASHKIFSIAFHLKS